MRKRTKWYSKLVLYILTLSLINPIFLSAGVSATETINQSEKIIEEIKENEESQPEERKSTKELEESDKDDLEKSNSTDSTEVEEPVESFETSEDVHNSDSINDSELDPNDGKMDDSKSEDKIEVIKESENEKKLEDPKEYFSAEETREEAMQILEESQKQAPTVFRIMSTSVNPKTFINAISDYAISVAKEYNLYASVMIAQAGLESAWGSSVLAYAPNYNLFGIKGEYNGLSFSKYSKEYSDKNGWQFIKSDFKKYPTYKESFIDYAKKLRNGPEWDRKQGSYSPNNYKGTWKENAKSYKDATKALITAQYKYANDPEYNSKLNGIIETYNLTQYDDPKKQLPGKGENLEEDILYYDEILSENKNSYAAEINTTTDGIYTKPKGTIGSKVIASTTEYEGQEARVSKEAKTNNGIWALISVKGKELGWIDKRGLNIETITSTKNIKYVAKIKRSTDGINTKPFGVEGFETKLLSSEILGKEVRIIKEATTRRATWALITMDGKELGWIDKRGLNIETITSTKNVNYNAVINRSTDGINTKPFGVEGFVTRHMSSQYLNKNVRVTKEAVTRRATWALISLNGKELGWIDKSGLKTTPIIVIDAGHGGSDSGAASGGVLEKSLNLSVAKKVQQRLEKSGFKVIMTRTTDKFLELSERASIANNNNADIFVSIHANAFNGITSGIETFSYNKNGNAKNPIVANNPDRLLKSSLLSSEIQNSLISSTGAKNRGAKKGNFHVIRETEMSAVLVEMGFIDNATERTKLRTNNYQNKIADGISEGIRSYFSIVK